MEKGRWLSVRRSFGTRLSGALNQHRMYRNQGRRGEHELRVLARDRAGNEGEAEIGFGVE